MRAVCVRRFKDLMDDVMRAEGEEFLCTPDRLAQINATRYGTLAVEAPEPEEPEEPEPEEPEEPEPEEPERRKGAARGRGKNAE